LAWSQHYQLKKQSMAHQKDARVPLVITLGVLGLCVIGIIVAGYFHGHMDLPKVLENTFK